MTVVESTSRHCDDDLADGALPPLRIATAGSVDDGKSTLIGRLLHDAKGVFEDQLAAVTRASRRYGGGELNLALLTDGLRAEREQGITIDVAYRYFATPARSFVIADTPGHAEYTRNMVTGASVSDVAIVLVDARHGVVAQTARHLAVAALLGVDTIVLTVNKMDLVDWDVAVYERIVADIEHLLADVADAPRLIAVPVSALNGDNVVTVQPGAGAAWYGGPSLLDVLEQIEPQRRDSVGARLAVQWVIRSHSGGGDYRGFTGTLTGGALAVGDEVEVLPSRRRTTVSAIHRHGDPVERAEPGEAVAISLADDVDAGRGSVLVAAAGTSPTLTTEVVAELCWMIDTPLRPGSSWALKHQATWTTVTVESIVDRLDPEAATRSDADELVLNDLGTVRLRLADPLAVDPYSVHPEGGRLILVDPATNATAAAVIVRSAE